MATEIRLREATPRPGHDWHSAAYVRAWVAHYEELTATRSVAFDLLTDLIPWSTDTAIRILDMGAGWGPVTRHLLGRYPVARATLLDFSEPMFAEARRRLADFSGRVAFVRADLAQPGAVAAAVRVAGGPFDAIVSSLCVHTIRPTERVPTLYREIREALGPGGCFLNLDLVGTALPLLAVWQRARIEQLRRKCAAETGILPSYEEMAAHLEAQRAARHGVHAPKAVSAPSNPDVPFWVAPAAGTLGCGAAEGAGGAQAAPPGGGLARSLYEHLTWLQQAGFAAAECFWRQERQALIGGYRVPGAAR